MLNNKTDRELMVMKVEMEQALYQLQQQIQAVNNEILERVKQEQSKAENNGQTQSNER